MNNQIDYNRYGRDSGLFFAAYWDKHKFEIANSRNWDCKGDCPEWPNCFRRCTDHAKRVSTTGTLHAYDRYIHLAAAYLKKPISEVTFFDVCAAIGTVQREKNYSTATAGGIATAIRHIYDFAGKYGDAENITNYSKAKSKDEKAIDILVLLASDKPTAFIREELRKERDRLSDTTKSLTVWQMERLATFLTEHMEEDGRYVLICLMLYAGVRPAEGRALRWKDITPFVDHPEREILNLYQIRTPEGKINPRMKTENSYRRVPVHVELSALLKKRKAYVQAHARGPIDELPLCCFGNQFNRSCRDYEVAALAQKVFTSYLSMSKAEMYCYQIERLSEEYEGAIKDEEQSLTLYVLRRNFWTWLQALTELTDREKRLVMGHELTSDEKRKDYNDENLLWSICEKMDRCVISKELHKEHIYLNLNEQRGVAFKNNGLCRFVLTPEMLEKGVSLQMSVTTEEPGEAIRLVARSPVRAAGNIKPEVKIFGIQGDGSKRSINCEYENWCAHQKPVKPKSRED